MAAEEESCIPYRIMCRCGAREHVVAARNILAGETILVENPKITTPLSVISEVVNKQAIDTATAQSVEIEKGLHELYSAAGLVQHSCKPNCVFTMLEEDPWTVSVVAAVDIMEGKEVVRSFVQPTMSTMIRRRKLENEWNLFCKCERCQDPTELGSHTNTVLCEKCGGFMLLNNLLDLDNDPVWRCKRCKDVQKGCWVDANVSRLWGEVELMIQDYRYDVQSWLDLELEAATHLHPQHGVICEIAKWCVPIMARRVNNVDADPALIKNMRRKLRLAERYLAVLNIVEPGLNKTRGKAMYEVVECGLYLDGLDLKSDAMGLEMFQERAGEYLLMICEVIKILELLGTNSSFESMMLNSSKQIASACGRYTRSATKTALNLTPLCLTDSANIGTTAVIKFYESWADTYDSDMNQIESEDAGCLTSALTHWLAVTGHHVGDAAVLDVAAGTGLVGEKLHENGYSDVTALDISKEMLDKAEKKGVYKHFILSDFVDVAKDVPARSFDAVVMRGGFAAGHLPLASLEQMAACCKKGGLVINYMVLEFAQVVKEYKCIDQYVEDLEQAGVWKLLERKVTEQYCKNKKGLMHCLKAYGALRVPP